MRSRPFRRRPASRVFCPCLVARPLLLPGSASFPCAKSIDFPNRIGGLNYFDDDTHQYAPPNFEDVLKTLGDNDFEIEFSVKQYRPWLLALIGLIVEPMSAARGKIMRGTWELYGFETIIHARKR